MSAFSSGSDGSCSTWEVVTSSGLFLGSALLFQWLQRRGRLIYLAEELENERTSLDLECYMKRRMEDRLSFHELDDKLVSSSDDDGSSAGSFDGDFRASAQQEVHPTNNNWNHFEGYGCDDEEMEVKKLRKRKEKKAPKANLIRGSSFCSDCEEILEKMLEGDDLKEVDVVRLHSSDKISSFGEFLKRGRTISDGSKFNLPTLSALKSLEQSTLALPARRSPSVTQVNGILRNSTSLDAHGLSKGTKSEHHTALKRRSISFTDRHTSINGELSHVRKHSTQVRHENRAARTKYNASIMPNKLILIRHGQTLGNIDECLYATTPDNAMPLTELGWEQAREAGKQLKHIMSNSSKGEGIHFILSPYVRTVETFHGIASAWCEPSEFSHISDREQRLKAWYGRLLELGITWHEDPRIREQDFGNYQEPEKIKQAKIDRHRFGAFYYRFPHGESASDVSAHAVGIPVLVTTATSLCSHSACLLFEGFRPSFNIFRFTVALV